MSITRRWPLTGRPTPHRKEWDQPAADEKNPFLRQGDVSATSPRSTYHDSRRVIKVREGMDRLGITLSIFICGDNGSSGEGTLGGTVSEVAMLSLGTP